MNPVSLFAMIRYLLANKQKFAIILLIPIIIFTSWGFFVWYLNNSDTTKGSKSLSSDEMENLLQSNLTKTEKDKLDKEYPHLLGKSLWRTMTKFYISSGDPERADPIVSFFYKFIDLSEKDLEKYNELAKQKYSLIQLNKLTYVVSSTKEKTIEIRAYGPNKESAEFLNEIIQTQLINHAKNLPIEIYPINVDYSSATYPKAVFYKLAYEKYINPQKSDDTSFNLLQSDDARDITLFSRTLKNLGFGFAVGLIICFVLMVFGSTLDIKFLTINELKRLEYPIIGAYQLNPEVSLSLDDRIFSNNRILTEEDIITRIFFKIYHHTKKIPTSNIVMFDETVPISEWHNKFHELDMPITILPLKLTQGLLDAQQTNSFAIVVVSKNNFPYFVGDIYPYLEKNTVIAIAV